MSISTELWERYKDVYFFSNRELSFSQFAVITACNPLSIRVSNDENSRKNRTFENKLKNFNYCKLLVGDLKRTWLEESFAVEIPQYLAIELGKMAHQNAIYYVKNDELYLISCLENNILEKIGYLSQKYVISNTQ